jgi:hypothetical protein
MAKTKTVTKASRARSKPSGAAKKPKPKAAKKVVATAASTTSILVSNSLSLADLIDVGSRYPVARLVDLAKTFLARLGEFDFARFGLDATWAAAMNDLLGEIKASVESKATAQDGLLPTGEALDALVDKAKTWRKDALTIVKITPGLEHPTHVSTAGSIPKLIASMRALLPLVAHAKAATSGGGDAKKLAGAKLIADVGTAGDAHKKALVALSPELRALNREKGVLYKELKRMSDVARNVAGPAAHSFSVATHLRAHHGGRTKPVDPPPAPPPGGTDPTKTLS